jgi:cytochrome c-type biogenesis protein CcmE
MPGGSTGTPSDPISSPDQHASTVVDEDLLEHRPRRTPLLLLGLVALIAAGWLAVDAFQGSVVYYLTPTEALAADHGEVFRLAGLVVDGSVTREATGGLRFEVTDGSTTVPVRFDGRAPDGLGDGAEAVAEGRFADDGVFEADTVLARCASKFESELEQELDAP